MADGVTEQALSRLSHLPDNPGNPADLIAGQKYYDVEFIGGSISNVILTDVTINGSETARNDTIVTVAGDYTVLPDDYVIIILKDTPEITSVILPASPTNKRSIIVKDGSGNASSFNITVDGNGKDIDGDSTLVISNDYGAAEIYFDGTKWEFIGQVGLSGVSGPASAVNNAIALFDGTSGSVIKESDVLISGGDISEVNSISIANDGLKLLDTDDSQTLTITPGSNLTQDRVFTITTGDADRTLTMAGNATISGTNTGDQTITLTGAVTGTGTGSFATTIATPGTLTVSSANSTATAHTHAITSSSAPGAAASILATDSSGIIGSTGTRIVKIWATDLTVTNAITGSVTGNAATVTTINGKITAGANITITGSGTSVSPYEIAGGAGSSLTLETDGTPNGDQTLLNLIGGTNITLTDDGVGNVAIDATGGGSSISLETDGTPNTDQATLNLISGTNITLTPDGSGGVTIDASGSVATGFDNISSATNTTAAMVVGTGASLAVSGSGTIAATSCSGNAATATALQNARTVGGVSFNGTANIVPQTIESANEATDTTCFPLFVTASGTQQLQPKNNTSLTFNSNTGAFGSTSFSGAGTGLTGTASALSIGGNAATVTTNANLTGAVTSSGNATSLGSFSSANLATALTDETGSGSAVFATSPTLVTPILGTPTSGTLTNCTGLPVGGGGTGQSSYTDGQLLIGNSSGNTLTKATLTQGSGITITNGNGSITIAASGGGGGASLGLVYAFASGNLVM